MSFLTVYVCVHLYWCPTIWRGLYWGLVPRVIRRRRGGLYTFCDLCGQFTSSLSGCVSGGEAGIKQDGAGWRVGGVGGWGLGGGPDAPPRTVACLGDILLYMPIWTRATMECKEVCIPGWEKFQRLFWTKPKRLNTNLTWVRKPVHQIKLTRRRCSMISTL